MSDKPGTGGSTFTIKFDENWLRNPFILPEVDREMVLRTHIDKVEFYSNIELKAIIMFVPDTYQEYVIRDQDFPPLEKAYAQARMEEPVKYNYSILTKDNWDRIIKEAFYGKQPKI